jgi:hypothetical protein
MTTLFQDIDIFEKPVFETDDSENDEKTLITRNIHDDEHETEIYDRARAIYWKARRQRHIRPVNIL